MVGQYTPLIAGEIAKTGELVIGMRRKSTGRREGECYQRKEGKRKRLADDDD